MIEVAGKFWFSVYVLKCSDGKVYVGHTADLHRRIRDHHFGKVGYTSSRRPVQLVYFACFPDRYKAIAFEKYLKSGSGSAILRRRMIAGVFDEE